MPVRSALQQLELMKTRNSTKQIRAEEGNVAFNPMDILELGSRKINMQGFILYQIK